MFYVRALFPIISLSTNPLHQLFVFYEYNLIGDKTFKFLAMSSKNIELFKDTRNPSHFMSSSLRKYAVNGINDS